MTELEKIAYAKSFIDKLADGINPLDDTPIPEDDIANNVRLSRCFFYVSGILRQAMEFERKRELKEQKNTILRFSVTHEQLQHFEYSPTPISVTDIVQRINCLVEDVVERKMERLSYRQINQWLLDIGMMEWREWENGKSKRFPTPEGEAIGLVSLIWEKYGRRAPTIYFSEEAQRFIIDNMDAVMATKVEKGKKSYRSNGDAEDTEDSTSQFDG